jgi:hypothetical protein
MHKHLFYAGIMGMFLSLISCRTYFVSENDFKQKFAEPDSSFHHARIDSLIVYSSLTAYGKENKKKMLHIDSTWTIELQWMQGSLFQTRKRHLFKIAELSYCDSSVYFNTTLSGNHIRGRYRYSIPMERIYAIHVKKIPETDNTCWLKFAPLTLCDPYGGNSFRGGIEFKMYRNIAISAEAGGFIPNGLAGISNVRGIIAQPELKVYLNPKGRTTGDYISVEYLYKDSRFDLTDSIYGLPDYQITYRMHKRAQAILLKWGRQYVQGSHFVFDFNFGAGVRQVSGSNNLSDVQQNHIMEGEGHGGVIYTIIRDPGRIYEPQITVGFKLGWRIF